jgi:predicted glycosyltransferase
MQQHDFEALILKEEQKFNKSKREEIVPRFRSTSPFYYRKEHEDEELEEIIQNFERQIHYVVEQEAPTQGVKLSRGVELVLVTR